MVPILNVSRKGHGVAFSPCIYDIEYQRYFFNLAWRRQECFPAFHICLQKLNTCQPQNPTRRPRYLARLKIVTTSVGSKAQSGPQIKKINKKNNIEIDTAERRYLFFHRGRVATHSGLARKHSLRSQTHKYLYRFLDTLLVIPLLLISLKS